MAAINSDIASVQVNLVKLTTRIEASGAIALTLTEELAENSGKIHQLQTNTAIMDEKLQEETETIDNLLRHLPDGFLQKVASKSQTFSLASKDRHLVLGETEINEQNILEKFEKLELKTSSIDFALMNLQKKVFLKEAEALRERSEEVDNLGSDTMSDRLDEVEDELAKIKHSTTSLIQIVSEAERKDDKSDTKVRQVMAQLRSVLDKEKQDRISSDIVERSDQKELRLEEHTDIFEFKRILLSLTSRLEKLELDKLNLSDDSSENDNTNKINTSISNIDDDMDASTLTNQLQSTNQRLSTLENLYQESLVKKRHHRHKHEFKH